jgi:hypothetical protein
MSESEAEQAAPEREARGSMTQRVFAPMIASGAASYVRARDLPKLFGLSPDHFADASVAGTERIVTKLVALARAQHRLGRRRHWSYDLNRHLAVLTALKAERAHLARLRNAANLARLIADAAVARTPEAA